jgi:hypothetical protein
MEDLKVAIHKVEPQIADVMVPNCLYRGDGICPEMTPCGFGCAFREKHGSFDSIQERYDAYNADFYLTHKEKE